ncbi:hypothetical protein I4U23_028709 [Adineta vaga]|nr:hypothetical protein I4U23_028709 [Adineta vaga]
MEKNIPSSSRSKTALLYIAALRRQLDAIEHFTNEEKFHSFFATVKCEQGGDAREDAWCGLSWKQSLRVLMHIADYPSHGRRYHNLAEILIHFHIMPALTKSDGRNRDNNERSTELNRLASTNNNYRF